MPRACSRTTCSRAEAQQLFVDAGALRSVHALVKDKPGRTPLSAIKVWKDDPAAVIAQERRDQAPLFASIFASER